MYIEVNGYLRLSIHNLKLAFPDATFIHLVRDGRKVVRSMMSKSKSILEMIKSNNGVSKFELACMIWGHENKIICNHIQSYFRLEDIVRNYRNFSKLSSSIGINGGKKN